jgi:hypothetical protein
MLRRRYWVRTASGSGGPRWAQAVTMSRRKPQAAAPPAQHLGGRNRMEAASNPSPIGVWSFVKLTRTRVLHKRLRLTVDRPPEVLACEDFLHCRLKAGLRTTAAGGRPRPAVAPPDALLLATSAAATSRLQSCRHSSAPGCRRCSSRERRCRTESRRDPAGAPLARNALHPLQLLTS